jgi:hypothetical protein
MGHDHGPVIFRRDNKPIRAARRAASPNAA